MKYLYISILLIGIITICCSNKTEDDYFEGEVTYSIDYISYDTTYTEEFLKNQFGSKIVLTYKKGNFRELFYNTDDSLLYERYVDLDSNKMYSLRKGNDTVLWYSIKEVAVIS